MAGDVTEFQPGMPRARRELARYLRNLAEIIETDMAETEPNAAIIVLTGPRQHEVLWVGSKAEPGFARGALAAASAVLYAPFDTVGGNVRPRTHGYAVGRRSADVLPITRPAPADRPASDGGDDGR